MERQTVTPKPGDAFGRSGTDVASAIRALSDLDMVRLRALARLWSRGLRGGLDWTDVLHEAIARALDGSRPWPPQVPILAFLAGVMRSICDDHWRRARYEQRLLVSRDDPDQRGSSDDHSGEEPDPERVLVAVEALHNVYRLFEGDPLALKIIAGMADGLTAKDICKTYSISELDYDTTRRRMRRTLLRHQPNWSMR
jgi:DNA-directed RNA polymerase specialized sigma24 family protein